MKKETTFQIVLRANTEYVNAVNDGARAEVQENLLKQCDALMRTMILEAGLANEYREYCEKLFWPGKKH